MFDGAPAESAGARCSFEGLNMYSEPLLVNMFEA
jgi:hypothetical protein